VGSAGSASAATWRLHHHSLIKTQQTTEAEAEAEEAPHVQTQNTHTFRAGEREREREQEGEGEALPFALRTSKAEEGGGCHSVGTRAMRSNWRLPKNEIVAVVIFDRNSLPRIGVDVKEAGEFSERSLIASASRWRPSSRASASRAAVRVRAPRAATPGHRPPHAFLCVYVCVRVCGVCV
jgi:hypothetical protein